MIIVDIELKTSNEQKKIFRLKVDLGCFRSIKALFWKSEIDFPCVQPIRIAKEHERVQGEKKKNLFFSLKKNHLIVIYQCTG